MLAAPLAAADEVEDADSPDFTAVVERFAENAAPVFDPDTYVPLSAGSEKDFLSRLRRQRLEFDKKERERKRKVFEKLREKNYDAGTLGKKLADFRRQELQRSQKFAARQNEQLIQFMKKKKGGT